MTKNELAAYIDQTLLAPDATREQVKAFCETARKYCFKSVCINPVFIPLAKEILAGSDTKVCTVIDFPLGAGGLEVKTSQADIAISNGADETDFVVDLSLVKAHLWEELKDSLVFITRSVKEAAPFSQGSQKKIITKLILETCLLTDDEIVNACRCAKEGGFDFVKTSTGFYQKQPNGATLHAVQLMKETVGNEMQVKASGGIRTLEQALSFIEAGASRIGTSSGVKIIDSLT